MSNSALKGAYAKAHGVANENTLVLNRRLLNTYNRISNRVLNRSLSGVNLDLGCGDGGFSAVCSEHGIESTGFDYPQTDLEKDSFDIPDQSVDFVTMNAVIEHITNPANVLGEVYRMLKSGGLIFLRTPNWKMDHKEFYNDPTHVKPYSPESMRRTLQLQNFTVLFLEPGLIEKPWIYWQLPERIKWRVAKRLPGGTKSILAVGQKK